MKVTDLTPQEFRKFKEIIKATVHFNYTSGQAFDQLKADLGYEFNIRTIQRWLAKEKGGEQSEEVKGSCRIEQTGSEEQEVELLSDKVVTLEDALRKGGVDRDRWDVERFIVNSWEVGAKGPDGRIRTSPLWQVKVWLKAKKGWDPTEFKQILAEDLRKLAPSYRVPSHDDNPYAPVLIELSIFDAHFGKLAWAPETNQDYDLKICRSRYMKAGRDLLARTSYLNPERILYVVGNDFFHCDHKGLTTNGTPQDVDGRWQKAFRVGKDCAITLAEEASQIAPVDILIVPGNHDREKAFCLGEVLAARFHHNTNITVMNDPDVYSYYRWGKVLLGFVHGDNHGSDKKRRELPQTMATDRPKDWSETVWREWHLGHFHSELEDVWHYRKVEHVRDLAVRVLPSLSSTDAWHRQSGYCSVLAAEAHIYHKERGRWGYLVHATEA